jgi:hypothetical protein
MSTVKAGNCSFEMNKVVLTLTSMSHLQRIILSEIWCGQNDGAAKNGTSFQLMSVFQSSVTHSRVARAAHQAVTIKVRVYCVFACNFSMLACIVFCRGIDLQILVKIKGVPGLFFFIFFFSSFQFLY